MKFKTISTAFDLIDLDRKYLLFAEGDEEGQEGAGGGEGAEGGEEAAQEAVHGETEGAEAGSEAEDWRAAITDPEARKLADSSTDIDHFAKRTLDMRKKLSTAIVRPGKDAQPEDIAAYRKAMDIPEEATGYEFPDLPEGMELTEEVQQSREVWAGRFHELNIPASAAKELARMVNEDALAYEAAQVEADVKNADDAEAELRKAWQGAEYDRNMKYKERAAVEVFGEDFEDVRALELKNGRFALDDPRFIKALAKIGREMDEGSLGNVMTETDRDNAESELRQIREATAVAQSKGDNDEANRLYQKEQGVLARLNGSQAIVGAQGRAA